MTRLDEPLNTWGECVVGCVADGEGLTDAQRAQVRCLRERLRTIVERHNARVDA